MNQDEKTFTLEEAERLLPDLQRRIAALRELKESMERAAPSLARLAARAKEDSGSAAGTRYVQDLVEFQAGLRHFAELGCVLRDLDRGLLDFPAMLDGRRVFLCWAWGEPSIEWWHAPDAGFAGRQRLRR
jgi:hypothetical protein